MLSRLRAPNVVKKQSGVISGSTPHDAGTRLWQTILRSFTRFSLLNLAVASRRYCSAYGASPCPTARMLARQSRGRKGTNASARHRRRRAVTVGRLSRSLRGFKLLV